MNILLIGSGGREHAIANALAKSPRLKQLFISPGNPGTAQVGANVSLDSSNHDAVRQFCQDRAIELVVIGPEQPLIDGLSDALAKAGIAVFGPSQAAAQLEGSKGFTKDLCRENHIPTADYAVFDNENDALAYLLGKSAPIVVKADEIGRDV